MQQISDTVFAEDFLFEVSIATPLLPSPYEALPYLVIEDFLDDATCQEIIDGTQKDSNASTARLRSSAKTLDQSIRKTKVHAFSAHHLAEYNNAFETVKEKIEHFYALALTTSTKPQLLEYTTGSFYKAHADDSSLLLHKTGEIAGFKQVAPQRKITTLLLLSAHAKEATSPYQYSGGALAFNYFSDAAGKPIVFHPKMGTLLVFGSNPIYTHEVKILTGGQRYSVAQWHDAIL